MSSKSTSPRINRPRDSEDKLYQVCLNACIDGIRGLEIDKRRTEVDGMFGIFFTCRCTFLLLNLRTAEPKLDNKPSADLHLHINLEGSRTSPIKFGPATSLLSPPPSPSRVVAGKSSTSSAHLPLLTTGMERSVHAMLHGAPPTGGGRNGPPRGPHAAQPRASTVASPSWGTQDARSNLAVQPAENAGTFKLKKNAVKIVGAASTTPSALTTPSIVAPAAPIGSSPPAPGPVKAQFKQTEGFV